MTRRPPAVGDTVTYHGQTYTVTRVDRDQDCHELTLERTEGLSTVVTWVDACAVRQEETEP